MYVIYKVHMVPFSSTFLSRSTKSAIYPVIKFSSYSTRVNQNMGPPSAHS